MKKILLFLTLLISSISYSQSPEGINYQAVIRNSTGNLVVSTTVAIRVQVRQTTATGTVVYQERHSVITTAQGLVNMVIGGGTPQVGTFNGINWGVGTFFVNLAVDFTNGINYQDFGTQQLMSVPYALYAKSSGNQLNQWRYGNTAPPSSLGNFGDFYLNVITGNVYYKNTGTAWILTGNIKGPVGPTGAAGPQGPQGVAGTNGTNGTNGSNGQNTLVKTTTEAAGANCTIGGIKIEYGLDANNNGTLDLSEINASLIKYVCNGAVGATGATGAQGPIGLTGPAGATGAQGIQGIQGVAGTNGINGTNGVDGKNTLAKTTTEAAGANCTTGGVKIEYGLDANNNGTLDLSEINASLTKYVCNGAVGATGAQGIQGATGATGLQGPAGVAGAQGLQGVAGTNGANGINGTNGQNTLVKTTTESVGANCSTGGIKIEYGLDANNNGTLDIGEINPTLTKYVCNGAVGASGPQGAQGPIGLTGPTGAQGPIGLTGPTGAQGPIGLTGVAGPTGATGLQGPIGLTGPQGIQGVAGTNGTNGLNALIKTTTESAGANCNNGGTKIETGLDANGNGVLDAGEVNVSQTQFVCNGINGTQGSGMNSNMAHGYQSFSSNGYFVCPITGTYNIILWGANGGNGGNSSMAYGYFQGGVGGTGAFSEIIYNAAQGDTLYFAIGSQGLNGANCLYVGSGFYCCGSRPNGDNGSNTILGKNNNLINNYSLNVQGGYGGSGSSISCGNNGYAGSAGLNGQVLYGTNFNSSGFIILNQGLSQCKYENCPGDGKLLIRW